MIGEIILVAFCFFWAVLPFIIGFMDGIVSRRIKVKIWNFIFPFSLIGFAVGFIFTISLESDR